MTRADSLSPTVVLVSYWSNEEGIVCSDWLQDKITALRELGFEIVLITSMGSTLESTKGLKVVKVQTKLSASTWRLEQEQGVGKLSGRQIPLFTLVFGTLLDFLFKVLAGNVSWGKWFWAPSAAFAIARNVRESKPFVVFVTGGPSGAHFAALLARMKLKFKLVLEFQDPFIGSQFRASKLAFLVLEAIESMFVKRADLIVMTSRGALDALLKRHPKNANRLISVYPGSIHSAISRLSNDPNQHSFGSELTHFGTLYGSRNFSLILDLLHRSNIQNGHNQVSLVNYGHMDSELAESYANSREIQRRSAMPRSEALRRMAASGGLLLIQHRDSRSEETVPFKLYDYTKTDRPIFAVIANEELRELLSDELCFVVTYSDSLDYQVSQFLRYVEAIRNGQTASRAGLDTRDQLSLVFDKLP
ncbi:MAG: hypothetical protein RI929_291 [Actinomycetota bacterium]